ncbi:MAG: hypothetical protein IJ966_04900 [Bacilli bacterium]|nr:hypothetical protein [Bacilli bacterium]
MNYNYKTFISIINNYEKELEQNKDSNYKVLKAIKDVKDALDSVSELNQQEYNMFSQVLMLSLTGSMRRD